MPTELFTVHTPPDAWRLFQEHFHPTVRAERIATADALGRVLAETVIAPFDLDELVQMLGATGEAGRRSVEEMMAEVGKAKQGARLH